MVTLKTVLVGLRLTNIALIESLEIGFDKGFSAFTGETGAGKSIFLDAIDSLLGGLDSSSSRLLRVGTDTGIIEAYFSITESLNKWLRSNSFDLDQDEIIVTKEFKRKEERLITRYRLNGQIINRQQILQLRPLLIDLTMQGQAYKFSSPVKQLLWLDTFGSSLLKDKQKDVSNAWYKWKSAFSRLESFQQEYKSLQVSLNSDKLFLEDIKNADLQDPLEDITLLHDQDRLVHAVTLEETINKLFLYLKENSFGSSSVLENISICIQDLKGITTLDPSLSLKLEKVIDIQAIIQDFVSDLESYKFSLEADPGQLDIVQERIAVLKKLKLRYGMTLPELLAKRDSLLTQDNFEDLEITLTTLEKDEIRLRNERDQQNSELSKLRSIKAEEFASLLKKYLKPLGLSNVRFKVLLKDKTPSCNGKDEVQFMFSANPGQPLSPLSQIASGGEMSRFLLAIKRILSQLDNSTVLIFDEIDTGVSGRISSAISSALKEISQHRQVFCVTHQPLIAAVADHHFSVSKSINNGKTESKVRKLNDFDQRKRELAELAGGDFEEANLYAASLLENKAA